MAKQCCNLSDDSTQRFQLYLESVGTFSRRNPKISRYSVNICLTEKRKIDQKKLITLSFVLSTSLVKNHCSIVNKSGLVIQVHSPRQEAYMGQLQVQGQPGKLSHWLYLMVVVMG